MASWLERMIEGLNALPAHETVREVEWVVPTVQTIHIIAVGIVFTGSLIVALRALGLAGTHWSLARWQQRLGGWTAFALIMLLLTGAVMILAEPERELLNSLFLTKMPLVLLATILSFALGRGFGAGKAATSAGVRLGAVVVLLLWAVIMGLGRWIAYAG